MRLVAGILLLLAASPAMPSSTLCMFESPPTAPVPTVEFLGYEEIGPVLIHDTTGPRRLPHGSWKLLHFDRQSVRVHFTYTNPEDASLPPSFTLQGQGRHTRLAVGGRTYMGTLECGLW